MDFMPIFCDLKDKLCLVVGGGKVAGHKAKLLLKAQARLIIVSPVFNDELRALEKMPNVRLVNDSFSDTWLTGCWLAIAATDNQEINQQVYDCATRMQIFCNVVDDPLHTSFITPAVIDHSPIIVALSTGGNAPVLSSLLRQEIEDRLSSSSLVSQAMLAGYLRQRVKNTLSTTKTKRQFWRNFFTDRMLINAVECQDTLAINQHFKRLLAEAQTDTPSSGQK